LAAACFSEYVTAVTTIHFLLPYEERLSQEQKAWVRISPRNKVFKEVIAVLLCTMDLKCIACALKKRNQGIVAKIFLKSPI
jgi:hypothetical protein